MTKPNPITKDTPDFEAVIKAAMLSWEAQLQATDEAEAYDGFVDEILAAHNQGLRKAQSQILVDLMYKNMPVESESYGLWVRDQINRKLQIIQTPTNQKGGE